jgi:hypothetical protein
MKIRILLSAFALLCPILASALESAEEDLGFVSLFDGKTFAGWEHTGNWVIEDGAFYRKTKGGSSNSDKHSPTRFSPCGELSSQRNNRQKWKNSARSTCQS